MIWIATIGSILVAVIVWWGIWSARTRKEKANGSYALRFVYVEEDGSARELSADEREHLNTEFEGADGNRPYVKCRYRELAPDGKISGYLSRRRLPGSIHVNHSK
jgi:hypothetical protein